MKNKPSLPSIYPAPGSTQAAPAPSPFHSKDGFDLMGGPRIKPDIVPNARTPKHLIPKTGLRLGLSGGAPS